MRAADPLCVQGEDSVRLLKRLFLLDLCLMLSFLFSLAL